jgi:membrane protease subunit (stomatin/prohibitin family)
MALIDRIKYDADKNDEIVWKYPSENIKLGGQLVVNQSQEALFVKHGQALDLFGPGTHTLVTGNIPLLGGLINLPFGGDTPFTAEVWYVNKTIKRDLKWGTKSPIVVIDPKYQIPISLRSFGRWGYKIIESRSFLQQIVGTLEKVSSETIYEYFISLLLQKFTKALSTILAKQGMSFFEVHMFLDEIGDFAKNELESEFNSFGIELISLDIENVNIPSEEKEKIQHVMNQRFEAEQLSGANIGQSYSTIKSFDVLQAAAENEGGEAGGMMAAGLGLGVGAGVGAGVGQQMGSNISIKPEETPEEDEFEKKLAKLKSLFDKGLITEDEYKEKRAQVLTEI